MTHGNGVPGPTPYPLKLSDLVDADLVALRQLYPTASCQPVGIVIARFDRERAETVGAPHFADTIMGMTPD